MDLRVFFVQFWRQSYDFSLAGHQPLNQSHTHRTVQVGRDQDLQVQPFIGK